MPEGPPAETTARRVFLTGMMGCGKSAVGTRLAQLLGVSCLDNDALLALREGHDLVEVADEGPEHLHRVEAEIARDLCSHPAPFVAGIAASVVEDATSVAMLRASGTVIYLRARPETLLVRVRATPRPWLEDDPLGWIRTTLARREPLFVAAAHLVSDTDDATPDELAATLAGALGGAPAR
jgi:shikimate kinase